MTVNTWTDKALKYSVVHDTYMLRQKFNNSEIFNVQEILHGTGPL